MNNYQTIIPPPLLMVSPLVEAALREDIRSGDITTNALIPPSTQARAQMVFREAGVLCGAELAQLAFQTLDASAKIDISMTDGTMVQLGETVLAVDAAAAAVLTAERIALNFMQRMSGVATLTRRFVDAVTGTNARIVDTRKTTPGLRLLEKYAVRCGGGSNHRFALDDMVLIKDNHIALCGGVVQAVERARRYAGHSVKVELECDNIEQVKEAVAAGADIILLDNMTPEQLREAVGIIDKRAISEASGGVNLDTVRAIAESGVDLISVGALTHSARALDIGLDITIEGSA